MDVFRWGREGMRVGDFTLRRGIATGGFGEVWLAESDLVADALLGDGRTPRKKLRRAVKLLMDDVIDEATKASAVQHPNVVQVLSCGKLPGQPLWWVAMEYVDGYTLEQLRAWLPADLAPPMAVLLDVASGLLGGLAAVHEAQDVEGHWLRLIHRDIKPSNVMVSLKGEVKILDFGIAKELLAATRTMPSEVRFTPRYAAPEQHFGEAPTTGTDLFSWACVIYELAVGTPLYSGESFVEVERQKAIGWGQDCVRAQAARLGGLYGPLLRCLEREPGQRPASAREVQEIVVGLRSALPSRPRLEHLVRLRRDGLLPQDITGPLPPEWAELARWAMQPPLPQPLSTRLLHGERFDPGRAPPVPEDRIDPSGLVWPETYQPGWRAPDEELSVAMRSEPRSIVPEAPPARPAPPAPPPPPPVSVVPVPVVPVPVVPAPVAPLMVAPAPVVPARAALTQSSPPEDAAPPAPRPVAQPEPAPSGGAAPRSARKAPALSQEHLLILALLLLALLVAAGVGLVTPMLIDVLRSPSGAQAASTATAPVCVDADEDGFAACDPAGADQDCDDTDPAIHPGAPERCNGLDDDCDGAPGADEQEGADGARPCQGPAAVAAAEPARGGGSATAEQQGAKASTPSNHGPAAAGGGSGSATKKATTEPTFTCYEDNDHDSYGSSETLSSTSPTCAEVGLSQRSGDCNDGSPSIHPGATEDCGDKINSDCSAQDSCVMYAVTLNVLDRGGLTRQRLEVELTLKSFVTCDGVSFELLSGDYVPATHGVALTRSVGSVWTGEVVLSASESKSGARLTYRAWCSDRGQKTPLMLGDGNQNRTWAVP